MIRFEQVHRDRGSSARCGRLITPHGTVDTPVFMPVGTRGSVKGLTSSQLAATGTTAILANTYHLLLRPGADLVEQAGGLHQFMNWSRPIITDSGGFQVFSLSSLTRIDDAGVQFRSHIDGAPINLTPQSCMAVQNALGADVAMALDQCPPYPCTREAVEEAVNRTIRWAAACRDHHHHPRQALFGIVQGGIYPDLRVRCTSELLQLDLPGYAVGGLSVGESHEQMVEVLSHTVGLLPEDRPRYLMGVGMPHDIVEAVRHGIDMMDCVLPTRNGRNAYAFTATGSLKLRNLRHRDEHIPLEEGCCCEACIHFTRSYIRHLFSVEEMLGPILLSIHNIRFFHRLMTRLRELIRADCLDRIYDDFPITRSAPRRGWDTSDTAADA